MFSQIIRVMASAHRLGNRINYWLWLMLSMVSLGIIGCEGNVNIQGAHQIVRVNEDLSGTLTRGVALSPYDYNLASSYYSDPVDKIGRDVATTLGWSNYTTSHNSDSQNEWINVTANFSGSYGLYALMTEITSDEDEGAGGGRPGADNPGLSLTLDEDWRRKRYRYEGTLIALEATGATVPATAYAKLPGAIVSTNGRILSDGQMVAWEWGQYDYVPYYLETEIVKVEDEMIYGAVGGAVLLLLLIVIIFVKRRKPKEKSPEDIGY